MSWLPDIPEDDPNEHYGQLELHEHPAKLVTRKEWGAEEPREKVEFKEYPVPYLVCMHTRTRPCRDKEDCKRAVKEIQKSYMDKGEPDIPFNYLIDMEGNIYIGRGAATVSMLYPEDNNKFSKANMKSINIGYIGSGGFEPPSDLIIGSASLTSLLIDGKFIDENTALLWYEIPLEGFPVEESEEKSPADQLRDDIEALNMSMIGDKRSLELAKKIASL